MTSFLRVVSLNRSTSSLKLSIVIPCFNEGMNIPLLVEKVSTIKTSSIEFVFVNNGSTDRSKEILNQALKLNSNIRVIHLEQNIGYGHGILSGLKAASGEFLGWTHADLQTDLNDLLVAYKEMEKDQFSTNLFIKGKRFGRPFVDFFFTFGMSIFESLYLKTFLFDINAQPTIFHRSFFKTWENPPLDFALDLYAYYLAKRANLKIIRFPVLFGPRFFGPSHWNTGFKARIKFIKRTINFSSNLKKRLL